MMQEIFSDPEYIEGPWSKFEFFDIVGLHAVKSQPFRVTIAGPGKSGEIIEMDLEFECYGIRLFSEMILENFVTPDYFGVFSSSRSPLLEWASAGALLPDHLENSKHFAIVADTQVCEYIGLAPPTEVLTTNRII